MTRQLTVFCFQIANRIGQIDVGAAMIEMHAYVRITLRCFDHSSVERGAADRVDVFVRVAVVRDKDCRPSRPGGMNYSDASFDLAGFEIIGGYAVQPRWRDGHVTGIYSFQYLRRLSSSVTST